MQVLRLSSPKVRYHGAGQGTTPRGWSSSQRERPVTYWRQHRKGWVLALGSGEPTVGDVGVAETPPQPGKHRF